MFKPLSALAAVLCLAAPSFAGGYGAQAVVLPQTGCCQQQVVQPVVSYQQVYSQAVVAQPVLAYQQPVVLRQSVGYGYGGGQSVILRQNAGYGAAVVGQPSLQVNVNNFGRQRLLGGGLFNRGGGQVIRQRSVTRIR